MIEQDNQTQGREKLAGLFTKAFVIRRIDEQIRNENSGGYQEAGESGISQDDQKEIITEIEKIATESRIKTSPEVFIIQPLKNGIIFPVVVNIMAVLFMASVVFVLYVFFRAEEKSISTNSGTYAANTTDLIIQALKRQSEEELSKKEEEISSIQNTLKQIEEDKKNLELSYNQKQDELRAEIEIQVMALRQGGASDQQIEEKRREIEAKYQADLEEQKKQLVYYKQLEDESKSKKLALEKEYQDKLQGAQAEQQETKKKLEIFQEEKKQEELVNAQIIGYYATTKSFIANKDFAGAQKTLDSLEKYLSEPSILVLQGIRQRRDTELFIISSIRELIKSEQEKESADTAGIIASANQLLDLKNTIVQADVLYNSGNIVEAEKLYTAALKKIPQVYTTHAYFIAKKDEIIKKQQEAEKVRQDQLQYFLTQAETAYKAANYPLALSYYQEVIKFLPTTLGSSTGFFQSLTQTVYEVKKDLVRVAQNKEAKVLLDQGNNFFSNSAWDKAIESYLNVIKTYPQSDFVADSVKGINNCLIEKNKSTAFAVTSTTASSQKELDKMAADKKQLEDELNKIRAENEKLRKDLQEAQKLAASKATSTDSHPSGAEEGTATATELARLKQIEQQYLELTRSYLEYAQRENQLLAEKGEAGLIEAKVYLDRFMSSALFNMLFPNFWERIKMYDAAFEKAGRMAALQEIYDIIVTLAGIDVTARKIEYLRLEIQRSKSDEFKSRIVKELLGLVKAQ